MKTGAAVYTVYTIVLRARGLRGMHCFTGGTCSSMLASADQYLLYASIACTDRDIDAVYI